MDSIISLDPRVQRDRIPTDLAFGQPLEANELFETYEVLHQAKTGGRHTHVGSVHAPNAEMAYLFAKEQFGRRMATTSIWVVRTADVFTTGEDDAELYASAASSDKEYRNANVWKVRDKITQYKQAQALPPESAESSPLQ